MAKKTQGRETVESVATFLAAFSSGSEKKQIREYLVNNGLVRILVTDDTLRDEVIKVI